MSPSAEEQFPVSEQEKQVIHSLADISGKNGFRGLATLLPQAGVPETFNHGDEIELACVALCLPEDQGISSERIFWDAKPNSMTLPDGTTVDAYTIGVYDEHGTGIVWEWGKNDTYLVVRGRTNANGLEKTQTVMILEKGVCSVEQHEPNLKLQKIRLIGKNMATATMIVNSLPQEFAQLQDAIDVIRRDEIAQQKAIGRAARALIEGLFNKKRNAAYDGAFSLKGMTKIDMDILNAGEVEIANVNYLLPTEEIADMLPLSISATGAIHHADRITIQLPGLQQHITLALTKDDMATVAVNRSTPLMPTRLLPSVLNKIPAKLDLLNTMLWEAREVILVGTS